MKTQVIKRIRVPRASVLRVPRVRQKLDQLLNSMKRLKLVNKVTLGAKRPREFNNTNNTRNIKSRKIYQEQYPNRTKPLSKISFDELKSNIYNINRTIKVIRLTYFEMDNKQFIFNPVSHNYNNKYKIVFNKNLVYFIHYGIPGHATGAVLYKNYLYSFDPHGYSRNAISTKAAKFLAQRIGIPESHLIMYDGPLNKPYPQAHNSTKGVCFSFAMKYLETMARRLQNKWKNVNRINKNNYNHTIFNTFKNANKTACNIEVVRQERPAIYGTRTARATTK